MEQSERLVQAYYPDDPAMVLAARRPEPSPEQRLAAAVISKAVSDAGGVGDEDRLSALQFLAGGPSLEFWVSVAGLKLEAVQQRVRHALGERNERARQLSPAPALRLSSGGAEAVEAA